MHVKGISATVVFESSAVNRDDKLTGNITSTKKLSRFNGTYSFMSRAFVRHHLFETLQYLHGWEPAPVTVTEGENGKKEVIQFDFPAANIIDYPEIDLFGFMNTALKIQKDKKSRQKKSAEEEADKNKSKSEENITIIRKAPLGITKAISLEPWQADMAFYANHDMVRRAVEAGLDANPNPFQKEEHYSYYRVSFTLDLCRFGRHDIFLKDVPEPLQAWVNGLPAAEAEEHREDLGQLDQELRENARWHCIAGENGAVKGLVGYLSSRSVNQIVFVVSQQERKKRLQELLEAIKSGIAAHSSTEDYGITPVFSVTAALKVPVPVFHSYVNLVHGAVDAGPINKAVKNSYVVKAWYDGILPLAGRLEVDSDKFREWNSVEDVLQNLQ